MCYYLFHVPDLQTQVTDIWMLADHHAAGVFLSKPQGASEWRDLQGKTNTTNWCLQHRSGVCVRAWLCGCVRGYGILFVFVDEDNG